MDMNESLGKPGMDKLYCDLRRVLAQSGVTPEEQSSVLHILASNADRQTVEHDNAGSRRINLINQPRHQMSFWSWCLSVTISILVCVFLDRVFGPPYGDHGIGA